MRSGCGRSPPHFARFQGVRVAEPRNLTTLNESPGPTLVRAVSRWELVGVSINGVIGSGVYLLPAATAAMLGATSIWAVVLAGFAVGLIVLCFAEASSYFDQPGGGYLYTREAFGSFIGFEVGWMTWLARIAALAALSNGFALALAFIWPAVSAGIANRAVVLAPLLLLTVINLLGVKAGARTSVFLLLAKMLPLLFFVGVGIFFVDWTLVGEFELPRTTVLGETALLLLFAYAGFENTPAAAGEYRNPRRDVPFALLMTIGVVTIVYVAVQLVALGTLPELAESNSPLAEAAGRFAGSGAALFLTAGASVSILGTLSASAFFAPRYLFALSADGYGPPSLSRVHRTSRTPHVAIMTGAVMAGVLALSGTFVQLAMLSVIARLATVAGTVAAVPVLRRRFGSPSRPDAVVLPGGATIPALAMLVTLAFIASTTWLNLLAGAAALAVGAVIYAFRRAPDSDTALPPP